MGVNLDYWSNLVTRFYRSNELIVEYLGGADDESNLRSRLMDELQASRLSGR